MKYLDWKRKVIDRFAVNAAKCSDREFDRLLKKANAKENQELWWPHDLGGECG